MRLKFTTSHTQRAMQVLHKWLFCAVFTLCATSAQAEPVLHFYDQPFEMPSIVYNNTQGETESFESLKGNVVLLNLWATWCTPCAVEMPAFNFLQKRYGAGGFVVLPIAIQDKSENVQKFMQQKKLNHLSAKTDIEDMVGKTFKPKTMPTTYLINRKGQIIAGKEGLSEWLSQDMFNIIENELRKDQSEFKAPNMKVIDRTDDFGGGIRF